MTLRKVYLLSTVVLGLILFLDAITSLILAERPPSGLLGLLLAIHMGFSIGAIADFRRRGERAWLAWTWLLGGAGYWVGGLAMAEATPAASTILRHLPTEALIAQIGFGLGLIPLTIVSHAAGREAPRGPTPPEGSPRRHSGLGVASFVLSLSGPLVTLIGFVVAFLVVDEATRQAMENDAKYWGLAPVLPFVAGIGTECLACGLGVASLFSRDRRQGLGVAGLIIAGAVSALALFVLAAASIAAQLPAEAEPELPAPQAELAKEIAKGLMGN